MRQRSKDALLRKRSRTHLGNANGLVGVLPRAAFCNSPMILFCMCCSSARKIVGRWATSGRASSAGDSLRPKDYLNICASVHKNYKYTSTTTHALHMLALSSYKLPRSKTRAANCLPRNPLGARAIAPAFPSKPCQPESLTNPEAPSARPRWPNFSV